MVLFCEGNRNCFHIIHFRDSSSKLGYTFSKFTKEAPFIHRAVANLSYQVGAIFEKNGNIKNWGGAGSRIPLWGTFVHVFLMNYD